MLGAAWGTASGSKSAETTHAPAGEPKGHSGHESCLAGRGTEHRVSGSLGSFPNHRRHQGSCAALSMRHKENEVVLAGDGLTLSGLDERGRGKTSVEGKEDWKRKQEVNECFLLP